jgi:C4-dicarboxylate transporter, DctM subunit
VIGCTIFAAVSGSSAATCATIGKITLPELKKRGYSEDISIGTLGGAGTLGLLIPPSIIMIEYGVAANVSIAKLFIAGVIPGAAGHLFHGLHLGGGRYGADHPAGRLQSVRDSGADKKGNHLHRTHGVSLFVVMMLAVLGTYFFQDIVLWLPRQMA